MPAALARAALGCAGATLAFGVAQAQPAAPGPDVDADLNRGTARPLWELGLGAAALRLPDYRGSDESRNYLLPLPYIVYRGSWFKADRDGARALLFDSERVRADVSVAATTPARSRDNAARAGMPDLSGTFEVGPNLNLLLNHSTADRWRLELRLPLRAALTLQRSPEFIGTTFSPNLNLDLAGVAGAWNLGMLVGPVYSDRRYHGYFYDVDTAYATPVRPAYRARGGYGGWRALVATSRRIGDAWLGAFVRYDHLRGASFEPSPLVRRNAALTLGFGVSWVLARSSEQVRDAR